MWVRELIARKRHGEELAAAEIAALVAAYVRDEVPDYQMAALLMAICCRGMTGAETSALTAAMADSGKLLDLSHIAPYVADKHSTGGVGDKTTLVVAPLVAASGIPVAKLSGRGLGFTFGTIDKLECFAGLRVDLSAEEMRAQLAATGLVLAGASPELAPADARIYALRDVTATVECLPLIASSVMSKKLAAGAAGIVLDVKAGRGAFMRERAAAAELAQAMVDIGRRAGRRMAAVISEMNRPLGCAVGHTLEVREAIETLRGGGPADLQELALTLAALMVALGGQESAAAARQRLAAILASGEAVATLAAMVRAQGGEAAAVEDPARLPRAPLVEPLLARQSGWVAGVDALTVGQAAAALGGGRARKGDAIDRRVGVLLRARVGDWVEAGQPLLEIHAGDDDRLAAARQRLTLAFRFSEVREEPAPLIHQVLYAGEAADHG